MDDVDGGTLAQVQRTATSRHERVPLPLAATIVSQVLAGLHAAHEARNEAGAPLGIVHRDVSPQNVMVGADGVSRILDFGSAKALGRVQRTATGEVKGWVTSAPKDGPPAAPSASLPVAPASVTAAPPSVSWPDASATAVPDDAEPARPPFTTRAPLRARPAPSDECDNPYTLDARGQRTYKRAYLGSP